MRDLLTAVASGNENAQLAEISHEPVFVSQYQAIDEFFNIETNNTVIFKDILDNGIQPCFSMACSFPSITIFTSIRLSFNAITT